MNSLEKRKAWNYAFGMIRIDGLFPSNELREMSEKEISGQITLDEIRKNLDKMYGRKIND